MKFRFYDNDPQSLRFAINYSEIINNKEHAIDQTSPEVLRVTLKVTTYYVQLTVDKI